MTAESQTPEPMPCPFCGKSFIRVREFNARHWSVECNDTDCLHSGVRVVVQGLSRDDAVEAWNARRSPPTAGTTPTNNAEQWQDVAHRCVIEGVLHGMGIQPEGYERNRARAEGFANQYVKHIPELRELELSARLAPDLPAAPDPATDELRFLIVRKIDAGTVFYYAKEQGEDYWTDEVNNARQYRTREEAERRAAKFQYPAKWITVEEHIWTDAGRPAAAPDVPAEEPSDLLRDAEFILSTLRPARMAVVVDDDEMLITPSEVDRLAELLQRAHDAEARATALETDLASACKEREEWRELTVKWKREVARLTSERSALIEGKVWQMEDADGEPSGLWGWEGQVMIDTAHPERVQPPAASADEALAAYRAVLAQLPAEDET